ncbi:MAG TPA: M56 and MltD domain-containing protein [Steroidobacteraceae bacterium]|nr:M56 and MltD domain-containing protein [Steroidobacteraceae bacterium]
MTTVAIVNVYLGINMLLIVASLSLRLVTGVSSRSAQPVQFKHLLRFGYALGAAALLLPWLTQQSTSFGYATHSVQVWSASSMHPVTNVSDQSRLAIATAPRFSVPLDDSSQFAFYVLIAGLAMLLLRLALDARGALRILRAGHGLRRHRGLRIVVSQDVLIPFSFWTPGNYFIALPSALLLRPLDMRLALRHEAQHHRQGDTKVVYLCQAVSALFFWNPAAHWLASQLRTLQEFACDEALARSNVHIDSYCDCLVRVAEESVRQHGLVRVGMSNGNSMLLKRRIERLLRRPPKYLHGIVPSLSAAIAVGLLGIVSLATAAPIQDRRITIEIANEIMTKAQSGSSFPYAMNDAVLYQLNLLLGTPDGREHLRASLQRMSQLETTMSLTLALSYLPAELLAVPLVESGFQNSAPRSKAGVGAGVWMFIEPTARRFGLRVDSQVDERLNVESATLAATKMLAELYARYGDWPLAILAYNTGDRKITRGQRAGHRDAWALIREGYDNDPDYLPRVMAAMLVIRNPSLLD